MPPFAQSAGGFLSDRQIDILVTGMRKSWADAAGRCRALRPIPLARGDPSRGAAGLCADLARHATAPRARADQGAGSIVDASYLIAGQRPGPAHD